MSTRLSLRKQGGNSLLLLALILIAVFAAFFATNLSRSALNTRQERITADALGRARESLLSFALGQIYNGNIFPGQFPCPDLHDPNDSELSGLQGDANSVQCRTPASRIGRLPWRSMGIPPLRDGRGELLWYMVVEPFDRDSGSALPLNSDTPGLIAAYQQNGQVALNTPDNRAIAIIFAPGAALGAQLRTSLAEQLQAANYLERFASFDNASSNPAIARLHGPVLDAQHDIVLNDRIALINQQDLMPALERRAASEYLRALALYAQSHSGHYPNAADPASSGCSDSIWGTPCAPDPTRCQGRPPSVNHFGFSTDEFDWLYLNQWEQVMAYAVGGSLLAVAPAQCSATLTVDDQTAHAVLFTAGRAQNGQIRSNASQRANLSNYLEDSANQDSWQTGASGADQFTYPSTISNDHLYLVP